MADCEARVSKKRKNCGSPSAAGPVANDGLKVSKGGEEKMMLPKQVLEIPTLRSVVEELGIPVLSHAADEEAAMHRVHMNPLYTCPAPIDKGKRIANFVTLMYVGNLMQDEESRSACIRSSGGKLKPSELDHLLRVMDKVKRSKVLLPGQWRCLEHTLSRVMATGFFWQEDVDKSSRVLSVARQQGVILNKEGYMKLREAYKGVVFKSEASPPRFEVDVKQLELVMVEKLLDLPPFAQKLVFTRGPNSILPHENALQQCVMNAVLLLMRSELRVTFPVAITYADLWDAPDAYASRMLHQLYEAEMPSSTDNMLMVHTLTSLPVHHLDARSDFPPELLKQLIPEEMWLLDMIKFPIVDESKGPWKKQWPETKERWSLLVAQLMREAVRDKDLVGQPEMHQSHFRFSVPRNDLHDGSYDPDSDSDSDSEPEVDPEVHG